MHTCGICGTGIAGTSGDVCFAGTNCRRLEAPTPPSPSRRRRVTVEISIGNQLIRSHEVRHDRTRDVRRTRRARHRTGRPVDEPDRRAAGHPFAEVRRLAAGGEHGRCRHLLRQQLGDREAVDVRQHDVQQHRAGLPIPDRRERGGSIAGLTDDHEPEGFPGDGERERGKPAWSSTINTVHATCKSHPRVGRDIRGIPEIRAIRGCHRCAAGPTGLRCVDMDARNVLRMGAIAAVGSTAAQVVSAVLLPDEGTTVGEAVRAVADSAPWTGARLISLAAVVLAVVALTVVGGTIPEGTASDWTRAGQPLLVLTGAVGAAHGLVSLGLKGLADTWAQAGPPAPRRPRPSRPSAPTQPQLEDAPRRGR